MTSNGGPLRAVYRPGRLVGHVDRAVPSPASAQGLPQRITFSRARIMRSLHRPDGAEGLLLTAFPTLKRGANDRCASGATEIGASLVSKMDSCGGPDTLLCGTTEQLAEKSDCGI